MLDVGKKDFVEVQNQMLVEIAEEVEDEIEQGYYEQKAQVTEVILEEVPSSYILNVDVKRNATAHDLKPLVVKNVASVKVSIEGDFVAMLVVVLTS